jgi:SOS-response transcriptional repressor LexA
MRSGGFPGRQGLGTIPNPAADPLLFRVERFGNALRFVQPEIDLPDVAGRDAQRTSDPTVEAIVLAVLSKDLTSALLRDSLKLQNLSLMDLHGGYSERSKEVKNKNPIGEKVPMREQIGQRMRETRNRLGLSQEQMAQHFNVTTGAYGKWETGMNFPRGTVFAALARVAPEDERDFWLAQAGLRLEEKGELRQIPFYATSIAAGVPREVDDCVHQEPLTMPRSWLPSDGNLVAICVRGDSMAPIIQDGYIVVIDTLQRSPSKLLGRMVAAREGAGVTIKWLRRDGDTYLLEAQNISRRHQVRVLKPDGDFSIVGAVVKLIGDVPRLGQG